MKKRSVTLSVSVGRLLWCTRWFRCRTKSLRGEKLSKSSKVFLLRWGGRGSLHKWSEFSVYDGGGFFEQVPRELSPPPIVKGELSKISDKVAHRTPSPPSHKRRIRKISEKVSQRTPSVVKGELWQLEDLNPAHAQAETMLNTWVSRLVYSIRERLNTASFLTFINLIMSALFIRHKISLK